jgi:hypothetical protein
VFYKSSEIYEILPSSLGPFSQKEKGNSVLESHQVVLDEFHSQTRPVKQLHVSLAKEVCVTLNLEKVYKFFLRAKLFQWLYPHLNPTVEKVHLKEFLCQQTVFKVFHKPAMSFDTVRGLSYIPQSSS